MMACVTIRSVPSGDRRVALGSEGTPGRSAVVYASRLSQESAVSLSQVSGCLSCQHGISLERLLPHLAGAVVEAAELAGSCACGRVPALIMPCARGVASRRAVCTARTGGG